MVDSRRDEGLEGAPAPLGAVITLTILASVGTGILWTGLAFIVKHDYGFSQPRTLLLYLVTALTYVVGASQAGAMTRSLQRHLPPRSILAVILAFQGILCMGPLLVDGAWIIWVIAIVNAGFLSAVLWPLVESFLVSGRHGAGMRSAIGWWNMSWTSSVAASLLLMAPLVEHAARMLLVILGGLCFLALLVVPRLPKRPCMHDEGRAITEVPHVYAPMLQAARILLPMSYLLSGAVTPLLPYIFERLELAVIWETPITATWMISRIVVTACLWRMTFWHGRWGTLWTAGACMMAGFVAVTLAPSVVVMLVGFLLLGCGLGMIYFAALYYAMAVGRAAVEAGGTHEAIIGLGYAAGPAASLAAMEASQWTQDTPRPMGQPFLQVLIVSVIALACTVLVIRIRRRAQGGLSRAPRPR